MKLCGARVCAQERGGHSRRIWVITKGKWRGAERKNMKIERGKIQRSLAGCRDIVVFALKCIFYAYGWVSNSNFWRGKKKDLATRLMRRLAAGRGY